jgi:AraC-like DNA-binding protein
MRSESGNQLPVEAVSFRHQPEDAAEMSRLLQCPVHTGSSWNGWALRKDGWRLPLRRSDPVMRGWLESKAARVIAAQSAGTSASDQVRKVLVSRLSGGDMHLGKVAHLLATTPRTLQRRLAREGTSYDDLRDSVRRAAADELLDDTALSVGEIAYLLGYSEPAAFHRACKRWFSASPQALRRRFASLETPSGFSR